MTQNLHLARRFGFLCLAGAVVQIIYGVLATRFPYSPDLYYGWDEMLWLIANIGMMGAVAGLLILDVGRPRWLAMVSGFMALVGLAIRIVASLLIITRTTLDPLGLILASILLVLVGIAILGVATLRGKRLIGWQAWMPLLAAVFGMGVTALFSLNLYLHFILLGLWGVTWLLIGYVIIAYVSKQDRAGDLTEYPALP